MSYADNTDQTLTSHSNELVPRLVIQIPGQAEHEETLRAKTISLGRNKGNSIRLHSRVVSGQHVRLDWQGQSYTITDLDSINGTFVNDQRLTPRQPQPLSHNDRIRFSNATEQAVRLTYLAPESAAVMARPATPVSEQIAIGSVNFADIEGSQIQIGDITVDVKAGGDIVGRDKIVNNVNHFIQQAATAAREAEDAYAYATKRLADGVKSYAQRLAAVATQTDAAEGGPYKGLLAYRLSDAELFYGRQQAIDTLLKTISRSPLTVLHSKSGAGKSSLLQAGISPHLLVRDGVHLPVYLRPYNISPTLAIKRAFLPNIDDIPELAAAPLQGFLRQVADVLGPQATLYLLLDQFEELFTVLPEEDRAAFITDLAACLRDDTLRVRWVLALRSEFFSDIANFRPEIENPFENEYRLNRLTRQEAAQVIVVPAARQGIGFEAALVEMLLAELRDDKGELAPPQLQLVCSALYNLLLERQRSTPNLPSQITLKMYEEEGRAKGILQGHLRRVLSRTLPTKAERDLARQVLVTLISSDQRRRRLTESHLARELSTYITTAQAAGEVVEQLDPLLGRLVKSRLLNIERDEDTDEVSYELAHDYLLAEIEIDPELQAQKAAQEMLDQEVESYKRFETLLSEDKFRIINSQREFLVVDDDAAELLRLSEGVIEAEAREKEAQQQRELESARKLTEEAEARQKAEEERAQEAEARATEQAQAATGLRRRAMIAAGVGVIAVIAAVVAGIFFFSAQENAQLAEDRAEEAETAQAQAFAQATVAAENEAEAFAQATVAAENEARAFTQATVAAENEAEALAQATAAFEAQKTAEAERDRADAENTRANTEASRAETEAERAKTEAEIALAQSLAAAAPRNNNDSELTTLLAIEAQHINQTTPSYAPLWLIDRTLRDVLSQPYFNTTLSGHEFRVDSVAFSPDGEWLASGSSDSTVRLWRLSEPKAEPLVLSGHEDSVESVAFSPDGEWLASGSYDRTVRLWRLSELEAEPSVLNGHEGLAFSVTFSPDGKWLASGSDNTVRLWRLSEPEAEPLVLSELGYPFVRLTFSPDGKWLAASGGWDNTVTLWRLSEPEAEPLVLSGHEDWVSSVAFSPDGAWLASGSNDSTVRLWRLSEPEAEPRVLNGHEGWVSSVAFSPDGEWLASSSSSITEDTVRLWPLSEPETTPLVLSGHQASVNSVAFSPDGEWLASGSEKDGVRYDGVRLWRLSEPEVEPRLLSGHEDSINSVAFSPDGKWLASGNSFDTVHLSQLSELEAEPLVLSGHKGSVNSVAFSPDGEWLASGGGITVRLWRLSEPEAEPRLLSGHESQVNSVTFSLDGEWLASGSRDSTVRLWRLSEPKAAPRVLNGHEASVNSVAFSPDGEWLASGSTDYTVRVWPLSELGAEPLVLSGQEASVLSVAFSPDGKWLASGSTDQTVRLWPLSEPETTPRVLSGHKASVNSVAFSPDGEWLASGSPDDTVRLWLVNIDMLIEIGCSQVRRNLSWEEWQQYMPPGREYQRTCDNLPVHPSVVAAAE